MSVFVPRRSTVLVVSLLLGLVAADAAAQVNVGTGPLTGTLAETEPTAGVLSLGPVKLAPGLIIREIGWDSNVFDEAESESPKEDYLISGQPDVSVFTRLRFVKVSAYAGLEFNYFKTYTSEDSVGRAARGRVDVLLSRLRPFVAAGETKTRTRPNGEIDVRADRTDNEFSGGLAFDLSAHSLVYGAGVHTSYAFEDAFQDGVNVGQTMTRDGYVYSAGVRTDLTPLLALTVSGGYQEDRFEYVPLRNTESYYSSAALRFAPEGVINGAAQITYRNMKPVDPLVRPFQGLTGLVALSYSFLEVGRLYLGLGRNIEYSFDTAEAYYLENTVSLAYTHRIAGMVDVQVKGLRSVFDYDASETEPTHRDTLDTAGGSLGYNLKNRTRIALNYEFSRRQSPAFADRNYDRNRVFLSWLFAF